MDKLHQKTPLVKYKDAAQILQVKQVLMKLDNLQSSASFKIRGLGHCIQQALRKQPLLNTIVSSSGGNAGFAATIAAVELGLNVIVFVPNTTPESTRAILRKNGATVQVQGDVWDETHLKAMDYLDSLPKGTGFYVHPFEHPDTWIGHSTLIHEVNDQLQTLPDVIICSVGGGGLLCGILTGLIEVNPDKKPIVVAVETLGAHSFSEAVKAGRLVTLDGITSVAKSLGAKCVSQGTLDLRQRYGSGHVRSLVVSDQQAILGTLKFADDFRMLVEPACGASIAPVLVPGLLQQVVPELNATSLVMVEVCGGFGVDLKQLNSWKSQFNL